MDFYRRVSLACRAIPEGKVATYGQIALLCGKPGNSRQVGYALNRGLAGEVPAHRVVNHQGYLTGARSFEEPDTQESLLESEGVLVTKERPGQFRVSLKEYGWKNTLAEAEALRAAFRKEERDGRD